MLKWKVTIVKAKLSKQKFYNWRYDTKSRTNLKSISNINLLVGQRCIKDTKVVNHQFS